MARCPDATVEDIVTDPIVRALMKADRVDPTAFEALLRSRASKLPAIGKGGSVRDGGGRLGLCASGPNAG